MPSNAAFARSVERPRCRFSPKAALVVAGLLAMTAASPALAQSKPAAADTAATAASAAASASPTVAAPAVEPTPKPHEGAPPGSHSPPPSRGRNVPAYVALGVAGAAAVMGTVFGVSALGARSDFKAQPTTDNADRTDRKGLIADVSFAVAIASGVTALVLLLSNAPPEPKATALLPGWKRVLVTPVAGPGGGGLVGAVTF